MRWSRSFHPFRRIRHFGVLGNACRAAKFARIRAALALPEPTPVAEPVDYRKRYACSSDGGSISAPAAAAVWSRSASGRARRAIRLPIITCNATPHDDPPHTPQIDSETVPDRPVIDTES